MGCMLIYNIIYIYKTLIAEVMDDDPDCGHDLIDSFTIALASSVFDYNQYNPITIDGMKGIGNLTLAFLNLTTNPSLCRARDYLAIHTTTLAPEGNFCQ